MKAYCHKIVLFCVNRTANIYLTQTIFSPFIDQRNMNLAEQSERSEVCSSHTFERL